MARITTLDELNLLRTEGDWSRLRLAIHVPKVIYSALVNGVPSSNDVVNQINFDGGVGDLADIHTDMTLYVGTSAGARDLGELRIRKAPTSSIFYFGETSRVVWADNAHLTVVDHFPIREKVVRVNDGDTLMDSDVGFVDQHIDFDPVPVMGPHVVAELVGADVDVTLGPPADTPSWVFDSTIDGGTWVIPDAVAIDDDTAINPVVTFDTVGWHACYFTVDADNGKSFEGIRWVYIWDLENQPARAFKITEDPNASYDDGGWSFGVEMYDEAHLDEVRDGALVILFAEDWYGSTKQSLGPIEGRENILVVGWIAGESIEWDPETGGRVQFVVQGPQYWMKKNIKFAFEMLMATNTPATWNMMTALTVSRAVWHLLHWRFNITRLMDVILTDDERLAKTLKSNSSSLWSQINDVAFSKIFARPGCDRFARFWLEIDPQMVPEGDRDFPVVQTITKKDWEGKREFVRKAEMDTELCILFMSGERVDESGSSVVIYSLAPGHMSLPYGDPDIKDGYLVSDQTQGNEQAGLYMGWKNNPYLEIPIDMPQNNRMMDLWPRQYLAQAIAEEDTERGITEEFNLIPRSMTLRIDGEAGTISTSLVCEAESFATPAIDGDIPPPDSGLDDFDMSIPPLPDLEFPDVDFDYPDPTAVNENYPEKIIMGLYPYGVVYTENADEAAEDLSKVKWQTMNYGLDSDDLTGIANILVTPSGSIWLLTNDALGGNAARRRIYWASGLGAEWNLYYDAADNNDEWVTGIGLNPNKSEQIAFHTSEVFVPAVLGGSYPGSKFYRGNRSGYTFTSYPHGNPGLNPSDKFSIREKRTAIVFSDGQWFVYGSRAGGIANIQVPLRAIFTEGGVLVDELEYLAAASANGVPRHANAPGAGDKIYHWSEYSGTAGYTVDEDGGATENFFSSPQFYTVQGVSFSPTGTHAMGYHFTGTLPARLTTDGASWSAPSSAMVGLDVWENMGDDNRWLAGGGINIKFTMDQGANFIDLSGNLPYIAPLCDVTNIRFIS